MRFFLYLLWSIISLLVLVMIGAFIVLTVYEEQVEAKVVEKIELSTGRNIEIQSGFGFYFNPRPTFYAKDVKMANADWGSQDWMLEIESLEVSLSAAKLLHGEVSLYGVQVLRPKVLVEKDPRSAKINWIFDINREPKVFKRLADHLRIEAARINEAQIRIEVGPIHHLIKVEKAIGNTNIDSKVIEASAVAKLHNKPLILNAEFDNLRNMLLRQATRVQFEGRHGQTDFAGSGEIADILRWQGHHISLNLSTPSLTDIQPWLRTSLIETPEISATAQYIQAQKWSSAKLDNIQISSQALGGETRISGHVAKLQTLAGIKLKGSAHYPLAEIMRWKGKQSNSDALIDARFELSGDKNEKLALILDQANMKGTGIAMSGKGVIPHLLQSNTTGIPFTFSAESLAQLGSINAKQWFESDKLAGSFFLNRKDGKLALDEIKISAFSQRAFIQGELDDIANEQIGRFDIVAELNANDVERINTLNKKSFYAFDQTLVNAKMTSLKAEFQAPEASLQLKSEGLTIKLQGQVQDLVSLQIEAAKTTLEAKSISHINAQFGSDLPDIGAVSASGVLFGSLNNLFNIKEITAVIKDKHQLLNAVGTINRLSPNLSADLVIEAKIDGNSSLGPTLFESGSVLAGQLQGSGRAHLRANGINDWSLSEIDLKLSGQNQGSISGNINHFPKQTEIALIVDLNAVSDQNLPDNAIIDELQAQVLRFYAELNNAMSPETFSFNNIDAQFSLAAGKGSVKLAGSITDISNFEGIDLAIGFDTKDLNAMPYLAEIPFKPDIRGVGKLKMKGSLKKFNLTIDQATFDEGDIKGLIKFIIQEGQRPQITGKLSSDKFDILALLQQVKRKRLFSNEKFNFNWINEVNLDLEINAKVFNGVIAQLTDAQINLLLTDGLLQIPNMSGQVGLGRITFWLNVIAVDGSYNIVHSILGENIKPEHINLFGDSEIIRGGTVDIDIGLGGIGSSLAEYMGNAYGKIQLQLHDSLLKNKNIELFGADLLTGFTRIINPFKSKPEYLPVECGVIHFPVINGQAIASQGIAIKTDKVTVLGGGKIDLGTEQLQLLIKPKPRKGLGLSASTLTNIAKFTGDFANPKISIDAGSFLQSTATIGAAIASSGLTLLAQGLFTRNVANSDVCMQTLARPDNKAFSLKGSFSKAKLKDDVSFER